MINAKVNKNYVSLYTTRTRTKTETVFPTKTIDQIASTIIQGKPITVNQAIILMDKNTVMKTFEKNIVNHIAPPNSLASVGKGEEKILYSVNNNYLRTLAILHTGKFQIRDEKFGIIKKNLASREMVSGLSTGKDKLNIFFDGKECTSYSWTMGLFINSNYIKFKKNRNNSLHNSKIFNIPLGNGKIFRWRPDMTDMTEEEIKYLNINCGHSGTINMKWDWAEHLLTKEAKAFIRSFNNNIQTKKWTRNYAGFDVNDAYQTTFTGFSNIHLSDRFGRIYQMIAFFNSDAYWSGAKKKIAINHVNIMRINYGFFIYQVLLTIIGYFYQEENNSKVGIKTIKFFGIKQSTMNHLFCINSMLLNYLPLKVPGEGNEYNNLMFSLKKNKLLHFKTTNEVSEDNEHVSIINISHGTVYSNYYGIERVLSIIEQVKSKEVAIECMKNLTIKDSPINDTVKQNNCYLHFIVLNCFPNTLPYNISTGFPIVKSSGQLSQGKPTHLYDIDISITNKLRYITRQKFENDIKSLFNKFIRKTNDIMKFEQCYDIDVDSEMSHSSAVARGIGRDTRKRKHAAIHNILDPKYYKSCSLCILLEEYEEKEKNERNKIWKLILKKIKKQSNHAYNILTNSSYGYHRSERIKCVKYEMPFIFK